MEKHLRREVVTSTDPGSYRGRRAMRIGSEHRRRAILEAALRIIIRDGIRAVRHRAVAQEAGVPLSATTYYFKDIHDLIADTFMLFAENALVQVIDPAWIQIYQFTAQYSPDALKDGKKRVEFLAGMAKLAADFVEGQLQHHREHLLAEQAFMQAAILDERLRAQAENFRQKIREGLVAFCTMVGTIDPPMDAELIHEAFLQLEYEQLIRKDQVFDRERAERVLAHRFRLVVGVG